MNQLSQVYIAAAHAAAFAAMAKINTLLPDDERGDPQYEDHHAWFGEVRIHTTWVPKKGRDNKVLVDKDGRAVMVRMAKLEAHGPGNRARVLPLRTSFSWEQLFHVRAADPANARELKKLVLQSLYGENWAVAQGVVFEEARKGHLLTLVEDEEKAVVKAGVVDSEAPARKRRRGAQHEDRRAKRDVEVAAADTGTMFH